MNLTPLSFSSTVRSIEKDSDGRFEVTFDTRSAYYWLEPSMESAALLVQNALASGAPVEVTFDPGTMAITGVHECPESGSTAV